MATRFELALYGEDETRLRAAAEAAVREIVRLGKDLSSFVAHSQIGRLNRTAYDRPMRITPELVSLLTRVRQLSDLTDCAFDITVGPLLEAWGFRGRTERKPSDIEIAEALERVGIRHVRLDSAHRTVSFERKGMRLDLGGVGKGYAIDVACDVLMQAGVSCALIHGGTSTVRAVGSDPAGKPWRVAVRRPFSTGKEDGHGIVELVDEALSVSAVSGRFFETDEGLFGHVIDPRTGYPVKAADLAVVIVPNATDADALSTGLLVLGETGVSMLKGQVDGFRGQVTATARPPLEVAAEAEPRRDAVKPGEVQAGGWSNRYVSE